jgi:hypothetical protein
MGAGTTSFIWVLGLYQCIICIGPPLSTSVQALATLGAGSPPRRARMALYGRVHSAKGASFFTGRGASIHRTAESNHSRKPSSRQSQCEASISRMRCMITANISRIVES